MAFKDLSFQGNENIISSTSIGDVLIQSDRGIDFILDNDNTGTDNVVRFRNGAKLLFDDSDNSIYTISLEAQPSTENRFLYIPNENGILATRDFVSASISTGQQNLTTDGIPEGGSNLYYSDFRFDTRLSLKTTDDIAEGLNLYYTDSRARNAISVLGDLSYDPINGIISTQGLASSTTDDLVEGSLNLYFTDVRAQSAVANDIASGDSITLSSAQAYTDSVVNSVISTSIQTLTTDDVSEGTNLYYTDARVDARIPTTISTFTNDVNYADETYVDTAINNLVGGASAAFDTLKEIQDAMSTDAELATAISNLVIPTSVSELTNDADYVSEFTLEQYMGDSSIDGTIGNTVINRINTSLNTAKDYTDDEIAKIVIPTVPTNISAFTNDSGYLTTHQDLSAYALQTQLFSGSYTDLTNKPTIPSTTGLASETYVDNAINTLVGGAGAAFDTLVEIQNAMATDAELATAINELSIPTDVSDLTDTTNLLDHFSGAYADLTGKPTLFDGNYNSLTNKPSLFSGNYNDLTNKPTIPTVPTNISSFTNDAGYLTSVGTISYNDLTNKPTIPSTSGLASETYVDTAISNLVNGASASFDTLKEIQDAMATDAELASAINNLSIPTVPTNVSAFTNDAGYLTSVGTISYNDLTNKPTIPTVPTNVSAFTNDAGYVTTDTNTTYSAGNGIGLSTTTFSVAAGNGLTQQADGLAMSGSFTGTFTASGDVCAYSDRALKRNIKTIEGALDKVTQMRGVTFLKDGKASTGVIAQEVETVLPEVVNQDQYGMRSVAYGNIVGTLIEAIKEQQVQIEKLQSEIAKMKEK